jgi:pimeloyl-ACP methyl ester carboxylesterase
MVEVARTLAGRGIEALRLDYRGCGDSSGASTEMTLASMAEDAAAGAEYLRADRGCDRVALAGLRLGGAVALLASEGARADAVVMIEPVADGGSYVRELRRRMSIRRMLTKGQEAAGDAEDAGAPFDLDGTALDRGFLEELEALDLVEAARGFSGPDAAAAFVLQVGPRRAATVANASLAEASGEGAQLSVLRAEPFWLQTDYVDPAPAAEEVVRFLRGTLLGREPAKELADE